jgi:hypothetical protein
MARDVDQVSVWVRRIVIIITVFAMVVNLLWGMTYASWSFIQGAMPEAGLFLGTAFLLVIIELAAIILLVRSKSLLSGILFLIAGLAISCLFQIFHVILWWEFILPVAPLVCSGLTFIYGLRTRQHIEVEANSNKHLKE